MFLYSPQIGQRQQMGRYYNPMVNNVLNNEKLTVLCQADVFLIKSLPAHQRRSNIKRLNARLVIGTISAE